MLGSWRESNSIIAFKLAWVDGNFNEIQFIAEISNFMTSHIKQDQALNGPCNGMMSLCDSRIFHHIIVRCWEQSWIPEKCHELRACLTLLRCRMRNRKWNKYENLINYLVHNILQYSDTFEVSKVSTLILQINLQLFADTLH